MTVRSQVNASPKHLVLVSSWCIWLCIAPNIARFIVLHAFLLDVALLEQIASKRVKQELFNFAQALKLKRLGAADTNAS